MNIPNELKDLYIKNEKRLGIKFVLVVLGLMAIFTPIVFYFLYVVVLKQLDPLGPILLALAMGMILAFLTLAFLDILNLKYKVGLIDELKGETYLSDYCLKYKTQFKDISGLTQEAKEFLENHRNLKIQDCKF